MIGVYDHFWNESEEHELAISCITDIMDYVSVHEDFFSPLRVVLCGDFNDLRKYYNTTLSLISSSLKSLFSFLLEMINPRPNFL